jgi:hypothetical protein
MDMTSLCLSDVTYIHKRKQKAHPQVIALEGHSENKVGPVKTSSFPIFFYCKCQFCPSFGQLASCDGE